MASAGGPARAKRVEMNLLAPGLRLECPNYSTFVETGSSPLPCSQRKRVCRGMRHRTLFPREKSKHLPVLV